jgi:hypothetical protein
MGYTITEALTALHDEIDHTGVNPTERNIFDDEDLEMFALDYLKAHLSDAFNAPELDPAIAERLASLAIPDAHIGAMERECIALMGVRRTPFDEPVRHSESELHAAVLRNCATEQTHFEHHVLSIVDPRWESTDGGLTTSLFWECNCDGPEARESYAYIHPRSESHCIICDALSSSLDCPDARIIECIDAMLSPTR